MSTSMLRPNLGIASSSSSSSRSIPPSRSSSFMPTPRSSTPSATYPSSITSSSSQNLEHHHHNALSSKLKHMFDNQKYALFETTVIINELGNVPQLSGEFDVKWKFRGKRPRGKEMIELSKKGHHPIPKPSLPNLKLQSQSVNPSASSLSVGTTSTASSGVYPPTPRSLLNPPSSTTTSRVPKSLTLPPQKDGIPAKPDKKASDPTPLKQVLALGQDSPQSEEFPTAMESPQQISEEPEIDEDGTRSRSTSGSSRQSTQSSAGLPPLINIHRPIPSRDSSEVSTDKLPFPKTVPIRGGTTPSVSTLIDPVQDQDEIFNPDRRNRMSRTASVATTASSSTTSTTNAHISQRLRSVSGPGPKIDNSQADSEMRKGTTPSKPLKSHACKWDYELHHMFRVPLSKPIPPSTTPSGTYPYRQKPLGPPLPIVGSGPLSESGLRLEIQQLPTSSSTSHGRTKGKGEEGSIVDVIRKEVREKTVFGIVDLDLAAFAGKGKLTRRFLLKGSRTNATIKLTVDMKWIGGEDKWAAPPMQEGHHVSGVSDFMPMDPQEGTRSDLGLVKTPSNSSSGSSLDLQRTRTNYSTSTNQTRNPSMTSLVRSVTRNSHQPFESHLRPTVSRSQTSTQARPTSTVSLQSGQISPRRKHDNTVPSPMILNLSKVHDHHRHHTHHLRKRNGGGGHRQTLSNGINDLPPEVIIEAIFNPHPANVNGPFTYIPASSNNSELQGEKEVWAKVINQASGENGDNHLSENNTETGQGTPENVIDITNDTLEKNGNKHKIGWRMRNRIKAEKDRSVR
ncbi:uncharacterized protein IL334_007514 [Kwoniella shivajii]|uniref:C2 NT-type domain-containing protein n=1 Tax=Kwoniella shivajii TaxID=564305 RepID=A0ABZ1D9P3_9TREE|nr:hypothetical protein IL334_007514 [Kwoniella shivajii]